MKKAKILFVCHGNICRSPMAEMIMKELARRAGVSGDLTVSSCATSTEEIVRGVGNPIYPPAQAELRRHGIPLENRRARQLVRADYDQYDLLIGMDGANLRNMHRILGGDPEGKIFKLLSFTGSEADVSDPWYSDRFDIAYRDIDAGCRALLRMLMEQA